MDLPNRFIAEFPPPLWLSLWDMFNILLCYYSIIVQIVMASLLKAQLDLSLLAFYLLTLVCLVQTFQLSE